MESGKILAGLPSFAVPDRFRVNTATLADDVEQIKRSGIKGVVLSTINGYVPDNIDFLYDLPDLEGVHMQEQVTDISPLYSLKKLKYLLLETKSEIDLARFPEMVHLRIGEWRTNIHNISQCKKLCWLYVYKFSPPKGGFELLYPGDSLRSLAITRSTLSSLSGIERFTSLRSLELNYFSKLSDISQIISLNDSLDILTFESCKKININILSKMDKLRALIVKKGGDVQSIKFIESMSALEGVCIFDTNILDGDISPFINNKNLQDVSFTDKKHYSLKEKDIEKALARRTPVN